MFVCAFFSSEMNEDRLHRLPNKFLRGQQKNAMQSDMLLLSSASCLVLAMGVLVVSQTIFSASSYTMTSLSGPGRPLPLPTSMKAKDWNISWWSAATSKNLSTANDAVKVSYQKGGYGSDDGIGFRAQPFGLVPSDTAVFSLDMFIPADHQYGGSVDGAKIPPGFCFGKKSGDCASGGTYEKEQGSVRCMWREDGILVAYVYLPGTSDEATLARQGPQFKKAAHVTGSGIDLWRREGPPMKLRKNAWNSIHVRVAMNTPGRNDGVIELGLNGDVRRVTDVNFRSAADIKIQHAFVSSFYGGGSTYAPTKDTYILLKNFKFGR